MAAIARRHSSYQPKSVGVGIVHIGLGAFHRAHQAVYLENWLNRNGGGDWGICAANIRSNAWLPETLTAQNCRFHVAEYADQEDVQITEVNSIRRALYAADDQRELLDQMTAPTTRIVTLTVTEKGYFLNPATGKLMLDAKEIAHDIEQPQAPRTTPGLLLESLKRRRSLDIPPFTVLSCDNLPDNGSRTRQAVCKLAEQSSVELAEWVDRHVAFPSSMVDRIVPAVTETARKRIEAHLGFADLAAVACESFSQWVIEDDFPLGRPDWEIEGVQMVADVKPYETMKLRLLNGTHSLLAYIGLRLGKTTVADAIANRELFSLAQAYCNEAAASLGQETDLDTEAYTKAMLMRFQNNALEHRLRQIAMDGSQKIPQRWLEGALINLEQNRPISATACAVAAWMAYVRGTDINDTSWQVDDPLAARLADCHLLSTGNDIVVALLDLREIFPERLSTREDFRAAIRNAYGRL